MSDDRFSPEAKKAMKEYFRAQKRAARRARLAFLEAKAKEVKD